MSPCTGLAGTGVLHPSLRIGTMAAMSDESKTSKGQLHKGPDHSAPYPVSRLAPPIRLTELAEQIETADIMASTRVSAKLQVIADQIRALQAEARKALEEARQDQDLNHVPCAFKRIPGKTYYLYRRDNGGRYFSMLAPEDWGGQSPHEFLGAYRLDIDMSWKPADVESAQDEARALVERLLGADRTS